MPDEEPDLPPTADQVEDMFACLTCPHCRGCIEHDVMFSDLATKEADGR